MDHSKTENMKFFDYSLGLGANRCRWPGFGPPCRQKANCEEFPHNKVIDSNEVAVSKLIHVIK